MKNCMRLKRGERMASSLLYFTIFIITGFLSEVSSRISSNNQLNKCIKNIFTTITLSIPAFFAGIRYGIGTDYFSYVRIFNNASLNNVTRIEPGYNIINITVRELGGNEHVLFFIVSFMTWFFIYQFLYNYKDNISVGLGMFIALLLFYNYSFNIVRQILAASITLYSFIYIDKKQWRKFLIVSLLATTIHIGAVIVIPFYYLYNKLGNKHFIFKVLIYLLVFFSIINYTFIIQFFSEQILKNPYYLKYAQPGETNFGIGLFIIFAPYIIPGLIFYNKFSKLNKSFELFFFLTIVSFIIRLVGYFGADHLNRIAYFLNVASIWLIPYYTSMLIKKLKWFWIPIISIGGVIIYWYITFILNGGAGTEVYTTIF